MLQPLKGLIKTAVHRAGISSQVTAAQIVAAVNAFLDEAVLPGLRTSVQVTSFQHGVLKVTCQNSVAAHEVRSLEAGIHQAVIAVDPKADLRHTAIHIHSASVDAFPDFSSL